MSEFFIRLQLGESAVLGKTSSLVQMFHSDIFPQKPRLHSSQLQLLAAEHLVQATSNQEGEGTSILGENWRNCPLLMPNGVRINVELRQPCDCCGEKDSWDIMKTAIHQVLGLSRDFDVLLLTTMLLTISNFNLDQVRKWNSLFLILNFIPNHLFKTSNFHVNQIQK